MQFCGLIIRRMPSDFELEKYYQYREVEVFGKNYEIRDLNVFELKEYLKSASVAENFFQCNVFVVSRCVRELRELDEAFVAANMGVSVLTELAKRVLEASGLESAVGSSEQSDPDESGGEPEKKT